MILGLEKPPSPAHEKNSHIFLHFSEISPELIFCKQKYGWQKELLPHMRTRQALSGISGKLLLDAISYDADARS